MLEHAVLAEREHAVIIRVATGHCGGGNGRRGERFATHRTAAVDHQAQCCSGLSPTAHAQAILAAVLGPETPLPARNRIESLPIANGPVLIARTGYTGEDGFEIASAPADAPALWNRLLEAGAGFGAKHVERALEPAAKIGHQHFNLRAR